MTEPRSPSPRTRRSGYALVTIFGAAVGLVVALLVLGLTGTSRQDAIARTTELVPPGSATTGPGEFDPPWWYGGTYTITQQFTGGASDREALAAAMHAHLESLGWRVDEVDERPGATVVLATYGDLVSRSQLRGPPITPTTEGVVQVRYAPRNEFIVLGIGALVGAAVAIAGRLSRRSPGRAPRRREI